MRRSTGPASYLDWKGVPASIDTRFTCRLHSLGGIERAILLLPDCDAWKPQDFASACWGGAVQDVD